MKMIKTILTLLFLLSTPLLAEIQWHTHFEEAVQLAKKEDKPLFLYFTGSDWCNWCVKFKKNYLKKQTFETQLENKFVFVLIDFPAKEKQSEETMLQNHKLKKQYNIQVFPTVLLLDNNLHEIAYTSYPKEDVEAYIKHLLTSLSSYNALATTLDNFDPSKYTSEELVNLHKKSLDLSREDLAETLFQVGLAREDTLYFIGEKYRTLVENGEKESAEAHTLRKTLLERDASNAEGMHYYVAVIEYQNLASMRDKSTEEIIAPLVNYLEQFASQDKENAWRIQVTISQTFAGKGEIEKALNYAKQAHEKAPEDIKNEIAESIEQMTFMHTEKV